MEQYISKNTIAAIIRKRFDEYSSSILKHYDACTEARASELGKILTILDTLEVIDPYEQYVQYDSIKAGIQALAETYSFNIESELFNQLTTEEQQGLWRKEIEQAYINGGEAGVELARDPRYKENIKEKEVDLDKKIKDYFDNQPIITRSKGVDYKLIPTGVDIAKHFFELGLKAQKER